MKENLEISDLPFAEQLWIYREEAGLSRIKLGSLCKIDPSYIHRLETGDRRVGKKTFNALVESLGLSGEQAENFALAAGPAGKAYLRELKETKKPSLVEELGKVLMRYSEDVNTEPVQVRPVLSKPGKLSPEDMKYFEEVMVPRCRELGRLMEEGK